MSEEFDVSVEELRAHASKLEGLGERLGTALDAARQVTLGDEAYGKICSFFVPVVHGVADPGVDSLSSLSESMGNTAAQVKASANEYESGDAGNAASFSGWDMDV